MSFKKLILIALTVATSSLIENADLFAGDKIRVVTTTSTVASLTREVVREKAEVSFIASPHRDVHFISPTPKDVLRVKRADVLIYAGLELEIWRRALVDAAGRRDLINGERAIDLSRGVKALEVPRELSRSEGDIHALGNPHYWLDPLNAKIMVRNIAEGMSKLYPEDAGYFEANAEECLSRLDQKMGVWDQQYRHEMPVPVVTYHKCWPYFAERFGLEVVGELESKPGIPPTAKHLAGLEKLMKERGVRIIIREPFRESRAARKIAERTDSEVLVLAQEVDSLPGTQDYIAMIETNLERIDGALSPEIKGERK